MNYNRVSHNLDAVRADGVTIPSNNDGLPTTFGVTLVAGTTYFFPFGADRSPMPAETALADAQMRWDNAIALTITVETCIFPSTHPEGGATGVVDVSDSNTTAGNWIPQAPPDAYVPVTGGGTYTVATGAVTVAAGQQGGCEFTLSDFGARRARLKVVVGATGGLVRCGVHGKAGS